MKRFLQRSFTWMRSHKKITAGVFLGLLIAVTGATVTAFALKYPGVSGEMWADLRHGSIEEFMETQDLYLYMGGMTEHLEENEEGLFNFDKAWKNRGTDPSWLRRGIMSWHYGAFDNAIDELNQERAINGDSREVLLWLGVAYLRKAENDNCLKYLQAGRTVSSPSLGGNEIQVCTLPLNLCHTTESSAKAATVFEQLLNEFDPDNELARWLLNFSHMTRNTWPSEVPKRYLIQNEFTDLFYGKGKELMEQKYKDLMFKDVAGGLGIDVEDAGKGLAVEDFDNDGWLDLVTGGSYSGVRYFRNLKGKGFEDLSVASGLSVLMQPHIITAADFNNDGWMDLLVSRPFHRPALMANQQDGTFRDVSKQWGLLDGISEDKFQHGWVSAWGDVDNDGDLDLFMACWGQRIPFFGGILAKERVSSQFFINEGNRFRDRTSEFGLTKWVEGENFSGATFGDYDDDGYTDLFLSSTTRGKSCLLKNLAGQGFKNVDVLKQEDPGFMAGFLDINQDGRLDLYQSSRQGAKTATQNAVFGRDKQAYANTIFIQNKAGQFEKRTDWFENQLPVHAMGTSYGDLNNDGAFDFYLGTGNPEGWFVLPNLMYMGKTKDGHPTGRSENISMLFGFGSIQKGHGIVFFDFDNDGDQDIYSSLGGMWPSDTWPNQFFLNESKKDNAWIRIRLKGSQTNAFGVGAKIQVRAETATGKALIRYYHMDNKMGFGSAPYLAHIGLGKATRIKEILVYWPGSGTMKSYAGSIRAMNVLAEVDGVRQRR